MRLALDRVHAVEQFQPRRAEERLARQLVERPRIELVPVAGLVHRERVEVLLLRPDLLELFGKQPCVLLAGEAREIRQHRFGPRLADIRPVEVEKEHVIVVHEVGLDHHRPAVVAPAPLPARRNRDEPPVADPHRGAARLDDPRLVQRQKKRPKILLERHRRTLEPQLRRERLLRREPAQEFRVRTLLFVIELDERAEELTRLLLVHQQFPVRLLRPHLRGGRAVLRGVADVAARRARILRHLAEEAFHELRAGVVLFGGQVHHVERKHDAVAVNLRLADRRRERDRDREARLAVVAPVVGQEDPRPAVAPHAERECVPDYLVRDGDLAVVVARNELDRDDVLALHVHDDADLRPDCLVSVAVGRRDADHEVAVLTVRDPCLVRLDRAGIALDEIAVMLQIVVLALAHVCEEPLRPAVADVFAHLVERRDRHAGVFDPPLEFEQPVDLRRLLLVRLKIVRFERLPERRVAVERFFAAVVAQQNVGVAVVGGAVRETAEARLQARSGQPVAVVGIVQHRTAVLAALHQAWEEAGALFGDVFSGFPLRHACAARILVDLAHELHLLIAQRALLLRKLARRAAQKRRPPRNPQPMRRQGAAAGRQGGAARRQHVRPVRLVRLVRPAREGRLVLFQ